MSIDTTNYFMADQAFYNDPFPYLDEVRNRSRVYQEPHYGVYIVTGLEDCLRVWRDEENFSSINAITGPYLKWPGSLEGDDLTSQIKAYRSQLGPQENQLVSLDGKEHDAMRALVSILFTPVRLKAVEEFVADYANQVIERMVNQGELDVYGGPARELTFFVIVKLLGMPMEEAQELMERIARNSPGKVGEPDGTGGTSASEASFRTSCAYFLERVKAARENPSDGILSQLANATYRDGSLPTADAVALMCVVLFGAGQESTARTIAHCLRYIAEHPEIQADLRANPDKIPNFVEEVLRYESPSKGTFRIVKKNTTLAGVDLPAGSVLTLLRIAANRDPDKFNNPHKLDIDRKNARQHVAFGGGVHMCIGQNLARLEVTTFVRLCLEKTKHIELVEGKNTFNYDFSYQIRGLQHLYLRLTPAQ